MFRFMAGIMIGIVATHWYYTQAESLRGMIDEVWNRASAPPARIQQADPRHQPPRKVN